MIKDFVLELMTLERSVRATSPSCGNVTTAMHRKINHCFKFN